MQSRFVATRLRGRALATSAIGLVLAWPLAMLPAPAAAQTCNSSGCSGSFSSSQTITRNDSSTATQTVSGASIITNSGTALTLNETGNGALETDFSGTNTLTGAINGLSFSSSGSGAFSQVIQSGSTAITGGAGSYAAYVSAPGGAVTFANATGAGASLGAVSVNSAGGNGLYLQGNTVTGYFGSGAAFSVSNGNTAAAIQLADTGAGSSLSFFSGSPTINLTATATGANNYGVQQTGSSASFYFQTGSISVQGDNSIGVSQSVSGAASLTLGSGAITVTPNSHTGTLEGSGGSYGVYLNSTAGGNITVNQAAGTSGGGINVTNDTGGATTGIYVTSASGTVGIDGNVAIISGNGSGISAYTTNGALTIGGNGGWAGAISAAGGSGIAANSTSAGPVSVTTASSGTVDASITGIAASSNGAGAVVVVAGGAIGSNTTPFFGINVSTNSGTTSVTANANVTGSQYGISVTNPGAGANTVTVGSGVTVTGATAGIQIIPGGISFGSAVTAINVYGKVAGNITDSSIANLSVTLTSSANVNDGVVTGTIFGSGHINTLLLNGTSATATQDLSRLTNFASITKSGSGTWILTGTSSINPAYTISSGTLQLGNGGTTGSLGSGALVDNATLVFDRSDASTVSNDISGAGAITVQSGNVTLAINSSGFTGTTTINSGATLAYGTFLSSGASLGGAIVDNGLFGYNQTGTVTVTSLSNVSGTGGLVQEGSGTLIIDTSSSLTGTSSVTSGILEVGDTNTPTASLAGGVAVGSGGTLEGHGTVKGNVTVASGGTLRPGGSIGTLTVNGAVSLPAGSTFSEEFSNSAGSRLAASGAVTLGGALQLVSDSTTYTSGTDYKFITASSISGTFSSVSGSITGYTTNVQYSASAVDLIITSTTPAATSPVITSYLFNTYGQTPNQVAAGAALTTSAYNSPLYLAVGTVVTANAAAAATTLGQLAGDIHPSLRSAAIEDARMIRDAMLGHMHRDPDGPILWGAGYGNFGSISDSNAANLSHRSGGFLVGGDLPIEATANHLRLGLAGGYSTDNASISGHLSAANGHEGHVGGYLTYTADAIHFYAGDDYGFGSIAIARAVSNLGAVLSDSQSQHSNQIFGELGYHVPDDLDLPLPLDPYLGIAQVTSSQGAFTETGGIAALSGASTSDSEAFTTLGLRSTFEDGITIGDASLTPHLDLGWEHALQKLTPAQSVTFQSTGQSFLVLGVPLSRDAAAVKAGIEARQGPVTLFLDYDGEFAGRLSENGISGGIDWQF